MKNKLTVAVIILSLWGTALYGQVGMMTNNPHKSAVLDLNESTDTANKKGLSVPRVSLSSITDVSKITGGVPVRNLLIYNVNDVMTNGLSGVGFYYWEKNRWNKLTTSTDIPGAASITSPKSTINITGVNTVLGATTVDINPGANNTVMTTDATGNIVWSPVSGLNSGWSLSGNSGTIPGVDFIGTTDTKDWVVKSNNAERIRVTATGNIGIATTNPSKKLEVNGTAQVNDNVFLKRTDDAPDDGISPLVVDNSTGQVYAVKSSEKAFNYIKYVIRNVYRDYLKDFNTNIPIGDYTMIVVGSSFNCNNSNAGLKQTYPDKDGTFSPMNVFAFQSGGTWRLAADYRGAYTADENDNGTWSLYCMVINNSMVKTFPDQVYDLGTWETGTGTKPYGL